MREIKCCGCLRTVTARCAAEAGKNNTGVASERKGALRHAGPLVFKPDYFNSSALM